MKKLSTEDYKNLVKELVGDEYSVIGEYINTSTKIEMKHNKCNSIYTVRPYAFIHKKSRCPNCSKHKPYTTETFKEKVKELSDNEYSVLGQYLNSQTKIKMKHNTCGYEYMVKPNTFVNGSRCPKCFTSVPYTTKTFKEKIYNIVGDKYTLINKYVNSDTKIKLRHNICGYEYEVFPQNFLRGNRCPICSYELKRSLPEEIIAYFVSKYFEIIQSYRPKWLEFETGQRAEIDIWIPDLKVGIEYDGNIHKSNSRYKNDIYKNTIIENTTECNMLVRLREQKTSKMKTTSKKIAIIQAEKSIAVTSKRGLDELEKMIKNLLELLGVYDINPKITDDIISECQNRSELYYEELGKPIRSRKIRTRKSNTAEFKERVYNLVGDEYTVLGEYTYALEKIKMKHNICGYEYEVRPNDFLNGRRCKRCACRKIYNADLFKEKIKELVGNEYTILNEYINYKTKIMFKHNKCGYEFMLKPCYFISGTRCPKCNKKIRYTTETYKQKVKEIVNNEYTVIGNYVNSKTKITVKHNICGYIYPVNPASFLYGSRCPNCSKNRKRLQNK